MLNPTPKTLEGAAEASGEVDRKFVTALARGLEVLRAFRRSEGVLSNQEIADRTGLPRPTVTRLTYTLTELGYLSLNTRHRKYQLAPAAISLGYVALANLAIPEVARAHMQALADEVGASVALGSRDRLSLVYLLHCRSRSTLTMQLDNGSRISLARSAMGRAYLAALAPFDREPLLDLIKRDAGSQWRVAEKGISHAMEEYASLGFVSSMGDWHPEVNGVAVPLVAADGSGVFAFNCGAPAVVFSASRMLNEVAPKLVGMVKQVELNLNGGMGLRSNSQRT